MKFQLNSTYQPTGDQPRAIEQISKGLSEGEQHQVLLGVTGSGKTFTMANVIQNVQKPTLVIAHNKTLAAQLYQEFRDFFPNNAVSYFVSYYDYYQPEAYIPTTDTYIEKESTINEEIDKLRLASTTNLLTRKDVIVIASVSCIYNLGSPVEYGKYVLELIEGEIISRETLLLQLSNLQYDRSDAELRRGAYRIRGDSIQVWPAYEDKAILIDTLGNKITTIKWIDPITGSVVVPDNPAAAQMHTSTSLSTSKGQLHSPAAKRFVIYPAKHYMMNPKSQEDSFKTIEHDLEFRLNEFKRDNKVIEAYRLKQKVTYDLEMMKEFGFVNGIENYSRYFDGRMPGSAPFTLLDYFLENAKNFSNGEYLTIVDESHITLPQIRGMFNGDQARKGTLIEYGFRLPSALDNRPLQFHEFMERSKQLVYVSATPEKLEVSLAEGNVVEQLIRPTGLIDPTIELRPIEGQIENLVIEVLLRKSLNQRVLVTTLTKRMAEALTEYLNQPEKIDALVKNFIDRSRIKSGMTSQDPDRVIWNEEDLPVDSMEVGPIESQFHNHLRELRDLKSLLPITEYPKVAYLHSDIVTLERSDILDDLRRGEYDVVVGINLLREGLDLPEVTLVAILDADKEGFLRSRTSLIQTMGRAARHSDGHVILYADRMTNSMKNAIGEVQRRRVIQIAHNLKHSLTPTTINKPIRERMIEKKPEEDDDYVLSDKNFKPGGMIVQLNKTERIDVDAIQPDALTAYDKKSLSGKLRRRMNQAAKDMDFELAALLRDKIRELE